MAICLAMLPFLGLRSAAAYPVISHDRGVRRIIGQVANITGPQTSPVAVTLQLGLQTTTVMVVSGTYITAHSAEADVEGLSSGDFALITVRGPETAFVAKRITYDVRPFPPLRQFEGSVGRESPNGKHFTLKLANGNTAFVRVLTRVSAFKVDGKLASLPPVLTKGEDAQVLAFHTFNGWAAATVSLRSTSGNQAHLN